VASFPLVRERAKDPLIGKATKRIQGTENKLEASTSSHTPTKESRGNHSFPCLISFCRAGRDRRIDSGRWSAGQSKEQIGPQFTLRMPVWRNSSIKIKIADPDRLRRRNSCPFPAAGVSSVLLWPFSVGRGGPVREARRKVPSAGGSKMSSCKKAVRPSPLLERCSRRANKKRLESGCGRSRVVVFCELRQDIHPRIWHRVGVRPCDEHIIANPINDLIQPAPPRSRVCSNDTKPDFVGYGRSAVGSGGNFMTESAPP